MALSWVCLDDPQPLQRSRASTFLFCRVHSCDRHEVRGSGDEGGRGGNSSHVPRIDVEMRAQFLLLLSARTLQIQPLGQKMPSVRGNSSPATTACPSLLVPRVPATAICCAAPHRQSSTKLQGGLLPIMPGGMPRQIHAHLVAGPCASVSPRANVTTPRGAALRIGGTLPLTRRAPTLGSLPLLCLFMFGVGLRLMLSKPRFRNAQKLLAPRAPARTVQRTAVTRRTREVSGAAR
eukprot:COSAG01_NODE_4566_length_4918_cov_6.112056_4_plen_235_part_00